MIQNDVRRSRRWRRCDRCGDGIQRGDRYVHSVASPQHDDLGNTKWWRLTECEPCARACGRGHLFDPAPAPSEGERE